jgi:hypothetical protein
LFNIQTENYLQEVDILVTKYRGKELERPLAIEVNGVHHYPRNAKIALGKDNIKKKIL